MITHIIKSDCGCEFEISPTGQLLRWCPLHKASSDMYEALKEADKVICELCKRLNPQHMTADYGKGCEWCQDRGARLRTLFKAEGK